MRIIIELKALDKELLKTVDILKIAEVAVQLEEMLGGKITTFNIER